MEVRIPHLLWSAVIITLHALKSKKLRNPIHIRSYLPLVLKLSSTWGRHRRYSWQPEDIIIRWGRPGNWPWTCPGRRRWSIIRLILLLNNTQIMPPPKILTSLCATGRRIWRLITAAVWTIIWCNIDWIKEVGDFFFSWW